MKRILASAAMLGLLAGAASAESILKHDDYTGEWTWVDTDTQDEHAVVMGNADGTRPGDCPDGTYFLGKDPRTGSKRVVMSCDDSEDLYGLVNPAPDARMATGDPYPEGTFLLTQSDRTDEWNVRTDEELN